MSFDLSPEFASLASLYEKMGEDMGAAFFSAESDAQESIVQAQSEIDALKQNQGDTSLAGPVPTITTTTAVAPASASPPGEVRLSSGRPRTISQGPQIPPVPAKGTKSYPHSVGRQDMPPPSLSRSSCSALRAEPTSASAPLGMRHKNGSTRSLQSFDESKEVDSAPDSKEASSTTTQSRFKMLRRMSLFGGLCGSSKVEPPQMRGKFLHLSPLRAYVTDHLSHHYRHTREN